MQSYNRIPLTLGIRCMIIRKGTYGDFVGRVVMLTARRPDPVTGKDYWETYPVLRGKLPDGRITPLKFTASGLMSLHDPVLHRELFLERREECTADPRMANYILAKDAYFGWKQKHPDAN